MTRQTCTLCDQDYYGQRTRRCRCQACTRAIQRAHQLTADLRPRTCENPECSNTFDVPKNVHHAKRYCSRDCKQTVMRRRRGQAPQPVAAPKAPPYMPRWKECPSCGCSFIRSDDTTYCTAWCVREQKITRTRAARKCLECPAIFTPTHGNEGCCSDTCRNRRSHRMTRDAMREADAGYYRERRRNPTVRNSVTIIAERDGWRCHLCGHKVKPADATRDHLIPLADGGTWQPDNLRLAHASCNSKRGRGRVPAQLLLIA